MYTKNRVILNPIETAIFKKIIENATTLTPIVPFGTIGGLHDIIISHTEADPLWCELTLYDEDTEILDRYWSYHTSFKTSNEWCRSVETSDGMVYCFNRLGQLTGITSGGEQK